MKFGCVFSHPPERRKECYYAEKCNKQGDCRFLHPKQDALTPAFDKKKHTDVAKLQFSVTLSDKRQKSVSLEVHKRQLCFACSVDTSGSMAGSRISTAVEGLGQAVGYMRDEDLFGLVTFDSTVKNLHKPMPRSRVDFSKDRENVLANNKTGGSTALWDAIHAGQLLMKEVLEKRKKDPDRKSKPKLVFEQLVITDGEDNQSKLSFEEIEKHVANPGIPNYNLVLIVVTRSMEEVHVQQLARLCAPEHAKMVSVRDVSELKESLQRHSDYLRMVVEEHDPRAKGHHTTKVVTQVPRDAAGLRQLSQSEAMIRQLAKLGFGMPQLK